jgi:hypothetical protein
MYITLLLVSSALLSVLPTQLWSPAVAGRDGQSLVAWQQGALDDIYGVRIGPEMVPLDAAAIPIGTTGGQLDSPELACDPENYLAVWRDWSLGGVYGARVAPTGEVLDPHGFTITRGQPQHEGNPCAAFNGTCYLVVWQEGQAGGDDDIYAARVSTDGAVIDSVAIPICTDPAHQSVPRVASDGTNFIVVWSDERGGSSSKDIFGARVSAAGVVLDPNGILICPSAGWLSHACVAFDGGNYVVAWPDDRNGYDDIYAARVAPDGAVLDSTGIAVCTAPRDQGSPAAACCGSNLLIAWQDRRTGDNNIYGARVTPDGTVLDTQGIAIHSLGGDQRTPAVSWDGTNYVVVWEFVIDSRTQQVYGGRVTPDGVSLDPMGRSISYPVVIEQTPNAEVQPTNSGPTIVRSVLNLHVDSRQNTGHSASLLDAAGRRVLDLQPGPNDVSRLAPGVYFVRDVSGELSAASCQKVIVTR